MIAESLVQDLSVSSVPPLPVAAARFPSQLLSLRKTVFAQDIQNDDTVNDFQRLAAVETSLQHVTDKLTTEAQTQAVFRARLAAVKQTQEALQVRLEALRASRAVAPTVLNLKLIQVVNILTNFDCLVSGIRRLKILAF